MKIKLEKDAQITMIHVLMAIEGHVIGVAGKNGTVTGRFTELDFDEDALPVLIVSEFDHLMNPTGDHRRVETGSQWDDVEVHVFAP